MSFDDSINYVVYSLRGYFSMQPGDLRLCPNCGKNISVLNLSPSKVVLDLLSHGTFPSHEFSVLYKCEGCPWWAIRECFGDYEGFAPGDFLVVDNEKNTLDLSQTRNKDASPWNLALNDPHLYDKALPLPHTLGRLFPKHREDLDT